ncbi:MAG: LCP family protein [Coprobacillus sp.]
MNKILSRRMLLILTLLAVAFFGYVVFELQILPLKFYIPLIIVVTAIPFLLYRGEKDKHQEHGVRVAVLKLINVLLAIILVVGSLYVMKGSGFISAITGGGDQKIEMQVIVLKSSSYNSLNDLTGKKFGANTAMDAVNVNKVEAQIEDEIGEIEVTPLTSYNKVVSNLINKTVDAVIIKAVDLESLDDIEKDFNEKIRVVKTIEITIPSVKANSAKVTKEPFNVLISGTDKKGPIGTFALSDVNMIATINPTTKQVLLTSIPRDYFVDIIGMDGVSGKDKLTHSAKGGINCTIQTVENLMGIKFNYYAKFNFTSFINVVDALGGITVDVPKYSVKGRTDGVFVTNKGNYTIKPGVNNFNADQALSFVRERKSFTQGDVVRGENQMLMLKTIIKKCCSPSVVTKLDSVFESLSSSFETNMSSSDVKSLINMQISDGGAWDIQSYHLTGDASQRSKTLATVGDVTKTNKAGLFIMIPEQVSVDKAKEYIKVVMDGKEVLKIKQDKEETAPKTTQQKTPTTTTTKKKTN